MILDRSYSRFWASSSFFYSLLQEESLNFWIGRLRAYKGAVNILFTFVWVLSEFYVLTVNDSSVFSILSKADKGEVTVRPFIYSLLNEVKLFSRGGTFRFYSFSLLFVMVCQSMLLNVLAAPPTLWFYFQNSIDPPPFWPMETMCWLFRWSLMF